MRRTPPDILITTPESLYLMLTSQAREMLRRVEAVIVDEIHAVASTKRGAHLALTLERLAALSEPARPAAHRPVARRRSRSRRSGASSSARGARAGSSTPASASRWTSRSTCRSSRWSSPTSRRRADRSTRSHGGEATRRSIWPAIYPELLELVREHRSTIIFVNNRRGAERLALRLNELGRARRSPRAHHGSLAREERTVVEELLKAGDLPCLVATSSLELGIDMGAVDLVLQVESPKSVARGLQRIGRAGHGVGERPRAGSSPSSAPTCSSARSSRGCMREGEIEPTVVPRNPLDVLAQQIVAIGRRGPEPVGVDELYALVTRTHSYAELRATAARERARHARRALPVGRVRRAAPADRLGPRRRDDPRAQGRPPAGDRQRRHDPRPRPVLGHAARRAPRRRARRGDGLRGAAGPDLPARRLDVAHRGDRPRPRDRHARAGRARRGAVLEGRRRRAARRSSARRSARSRAGRSTRRRDARARLRPRRARGAQPARLPARAAGRHARDPSDRTIVIERFRDEIGDWRLCVLSPVRRPRPRRLGAGAVGAPDPRASSASSPTRSGPTTGSSSTCPTPTSRPGAELVADRARRGRGAASSPSSASSALFGARFRENAAPRAADPARLPGQAHAAVAAAPEVPVPARGRQALRRLPDHPRDLPRVPARRARPARPARAADAACTAASCRWSRSRRRPPRRSPRRCCSTTSPPTCTRATRPTPSAAPPRCRSTATCCASCSARRSCAT